MKQAPNRPLSSLVCEIINPFVQEADKDRRTDIKSTEELCHEMNAANKEIMKIGLKGGLFQKDGNLIVWSKDVKCHYPNIDIDVVAEVAKLEVRESDIEIVWLCRRDGWEVGWGKGWVVGIRGGIELHIFVYL